MQRLTSTWDRMFGKLRSKRASKKRKGITPLKHRAFAVEPLEERTLLSVSPLGDETLLNSYTAGEQRLYDSGDAVAAMPDGGYVVTWTSEDQDGSGDGVYARRFDAEDGALGNEFLVNTTTAWGQQRSSVAVDADGGFVVVWDSYGQDGILAGVFGQRYDAQGQTVGGEFQVNETSLGHQCCPAVACLEDGGFVVVWSGPGNGDLWGVFGRRYDADGVADGGEFMVNSETNNIQRSAAVAALPESGFVVVWQSHGGQDGDITGIFGQRFDADCDPVGDEFQVNTTTDDRQENPAVAADANGRFTVVWQSKGQDGGGYGIFAQRFDADCTALGGEFQVNTYISNDQEYPSITYNAEGGFVVSWSGKGPGDSHGVFAREFDADGNALGDEVLVNQTTSQWQQYPTLATVGDQYVVVWSGRGAGDNNGVFLRRLGSSLSTDGIADVSVAEDASDTTIDLSTSFADPYNNPLTYEIIDTTNAELFDAVSIDGDQLTLDYAADQSGSAALTVRATNSLGEFIEAAFTVYVSPYNDAPAVLSFDPISVAEDSEPVTLSLGNVFQDIDDWFHGLRFEIMSNDNPALFTSVGLDAAGNALVLDFAPETSGTANIVIRATDEEGLWAEATVPVTVLTVNDAPVAASATTVLARQDAAPTVLDLTALFSDADDSVVNLSYEIIGNDNPSLVTTQLQNSQLTLSYAQGTTGTATIVVRAADSFGYYDEGSYHTINVTVSATNLAPQITGLLDAPDPAIEGATLYLTATGVIDDTAVSNVTFWRDADGDDAFDPAVDQLLGTDTDGSDGWGISVSSAGFGIGAQRYFAQATDEDLLTGNVATAMGIVGVVAILDNSAAGYTETGAGWTDNASGGYLDTARRHEAGSGTNTATWTFDGLMTKVHEFYITWRAESGLASNAQFSIYDGEQLLGTFTVDQRVAPDDANADGVSWLKLGEYTITSGQLTVVLTDAADGAVVADAVRLVDPPPTIESLSVTSTVSRPDDVTLTANNVADSDGTVVEVSFYRDTNGNSIFDSGTDELLGTDTSSDGGWSITADTLTFETGTQTYFARAKDNSALYSSAVWAQGVVEGPVAYGATSAYEGNTYTLQLDPTDIAITQWTIDWGDGSDDDVISGSARSYTHVYADGPNSWTIEVTGTDGVDTHYANTIDVTVQNIAPYLSIDGVAEVTEGSQYTLYLDVDDPGTDTITGWTIDWDDGGDPEYFPGNPSSVTHYYADGPNNYTITATANDEDDTDWPLGGEAGALDYSFGTDGSVTTAFSTGAGVEYGWVVAVDGNGKIVVAGEGADSADILLARYNANGTLDTSFGDDGRVVTNLGGYDFARAIAIQPDGKIVVAGRIINPDNNTYDFMLARYHTDGTLDLSFGDGGRVITSFGGTDGGCSIDFQSDGKILVAGFASAGGGGYNFAIARYTSDGRLDPSFDDDGMLTTDFNGSTDEARGMVLLPDDGILVVGYSYNGSNYDFALAKYNADGELDEDFDGDDPYNPGNGKVTTPIGAGDDIAYAVAVYSGKIIVAGRSYNGSNNDFALACYDLDYGTLDTTFDTDGKYTLPIGGGNDEAYAVAVKSNGDILVAGRTHNGSNYDFAVVCYDVSENDLDDGFDGDGVQTFSFGSSNDSAYSMALLEGNNQILVFGQSIMSVTSYDFALARLVCDGGSAGDLDTTFDSVDSDGKVTTDFPGRDNLRAAVVQADQKIVVAGYSYVDDEYEFTLARYDTDGTLDTTFDTDGMQTTDVSSGSTDYAYDMALQPDQKVVVVGYSSGNFGIARYTTAGVLDTTFDGDGLKTTDIAGSTDYAKAVAVQSDDDIVVAGYAYVSGSYDFAVVRYDDEGVLDTSFNGSGKKTTAIGSGTDYANAVALQTIGGEEKILVAGQAYIDGDYDFAIVRYDEDGDLDTSFDGDSGTGNGIVTYDFGYGDDIIYDIVVLDDGKILVAGSAENGSTLDFAMARFNDDGTLDTTFGTSGIVLTPFAANYDDYAYSIQVQSDDKILLGGMTYYNGHEDFVVARYTESGVLDSTFDDDGKVTTDFNRGREQGFAMALQSDDRIVLAGKGHDDFQLVRYLPGEVPHTVAVRDSAVYTWDGGGADDYWMTEDNWVGDVAPLPGDQLYFTSASAEEAENDFPEETVFESIEFASADFELSGNSITLTDGITVNSAATGSEINLDIQLDGSIEIDVATGADLTIDDDVYGLYGTGSLTKNGAGELILAGENTYSGDTRIGDGDLTLGNSLALQGSTLDMNDADSGSLSFGALSAATFGGLMGARNVTLPSNFTLTVGGNNADTTFSGQLNGTGSLTKVGSGRLTLTNGDRNFYSGATTVNNGTLEFRQPAALYGALTYLSGAVTISGNSSVLELNGNYTYLASNVTISNGGLLESNGSENSFFYSSTVSVDGKLYINGGCNYFPCYLTVAEGSTLRVATPLDGPILNWNSAKVTINGTLELAGHGSIASSSYCPPTYIENVIVTRDSTDATKLNLEWESQETGSEYTVKVSSDDGNTWTTVGTTTNKSFDVSDLQPGVDYRLQVISDSTHWSYDSGSVSTTDSAGMYQIASIEDAFGNTLELPEGGEVDYSWVYAASVEDAISQQITGVINEGDYAPPVVDPATGTVSIYVYSSTYSYSFGTAYSPSAPTRFTIYTQFLSLDETACDNPCGCESTDLDAPGTSGSTGASKTSVDAIDDDSGGCSTCGTGTGGLTYSSRATTIDSGFGPGWSDADEIPRLLDGQDTVVVQFGTEEAVWFDYADSTYTARNGAKATLVHDTVNDLYILSQPDGTKFEFYDSDQTNHPQGAFYRSVAPSGETVIVTGWTQAGVDGKIATVEYRTTETGDAHEKRDFTYYTSGTGRSGHVESVTLEHSDDGTNWDNVRQMTYDYYGWGGAGDDYGSTGDLKTVVIQNWDATASDWAGDDTYYYRYHTTPGLEHMVERVLLPAAYAAATASTYGQTYGSPENWVGDGQNDEIANFTCFYYVYDASGRVSEEVVFGKSNEYQVETTMNSDPDQYDADSDWMSDPDRYNDWHRKTVETKLDASESTLWVNTIYSNYLGQTILTDYYDAASDTHDITYHRYDADGSVILVADTSAFELYSSEYYDEELSDLIDYDGDSPYLNNSAGLFYVYTYYSSTTAGESTPGGAEGYIHQSAVAQGEAEAYGTSGTPDLTATYTYFAHTVDGETIYPTASRTTYTAINGDGAITTTYAYTWYTDSFQYSEIETTLPTVTTGQNGSNSADTTTQWYNEQGNLVRSIDELGHVIYYRYDSLTNRMIEKVEPAEGAGTALGDVNYGIAAKNDATETGYIMFSQQDLSERFDPDPYPNNSDHLIAVKYFDGYWHYDNNSVYTVFTPVDTDVLIASVDFDEDEIESLEGVDEVENGIAKGYRAGDLIFKANWWNGGYDADEFTVDGTYFVYQDCMITSYSHDALGRAAEVLGPIHQDDSGDWVRTASWTVYKDADHETWSASGYVTYTDSTGATISAQTLVNPVSITKTDADGRTTGAIQATAGTTSLGTGDPLTVIAAETFTQSEYTSWTTYQYSKTRLVSTRAYHDIPSSGAGTSGTNYYETAYGYENYGEAGIMGRQNRVESPDGTITRYVYDGSGRVIEVWTGTDDTNAYDSDPTGGSAAGNNMVLVSESIYNDDGELVESRTYYGSGANDYYATEYYYDWRGRMTDSRDAANVVTHNVYDNLGRAIETYAYADADEDYFTYTGDIITGTNVESAELRAKSESDYDNRGRVYETRTYEVDQDDGDVHDHLTADYWYDAAGRTIKTADSNGLFQKTEYDGAGRVVATYTCYDTDETTYAEADDVTGDTVVAQTNYYYNTAGQTVATAAFQRLPDDTATTGALDATNSYAAAAVFWYDGLGRTVASVNYGREDVDSGLTHYFFDGSTGALIDTNSDGVPDVAQDDPPAPDTSDNYIVSLVEYDSAGRAYKTTDNLGRENWTVYDDLGRTVKTIQNYDNGTVAETDTDQDVTVEYEYDSFGRLATMIVHNAKGSGNGVEDQETAYLYESAVNASWQTAVVYGDSTDTISQDGDGVWSITTGDDHIETTYDRLGRTITTTDQRGIVHTYVYDLAGRVWKDLATASGGWGDVDDSVQAIFTTYDDIGRVEFVTSYADTSGTTAVNQIEYQYGAWGNLVKEYQEHDGVVDGNTQYVEYTYADGASGGEAKYVRLSKVTYPDGRSVGYDYASGVDDIMSRISSIFDDADSDGVLDGGEDVYASYKYLGAGRIVGEDYEDIEVKIDYSENDFAALDRFGRVEDQIWTDYGEDPDVVLDHYSYTYDRAGNITAKDNELHAAFDEDYTYDDMDRLTDADRADNFDQSWTLDGLGNFGTFDDDGTSQDRTTNAANEITAMTGSWVDPQYDAAGNIIFGPQSGDETTGLHYVYDAWNRQVAVYEDDGDGTFEPSTDDTLIAEYEFDGAKRRIEKVLTASSADYYYNNSWQLLEVRQSDGSINQHVFSPDYIDSPVAWLHDANGDGDLEDQGDLIRYYLSDANHNTTAVVDSATGLVVNRYVYNAYGEHVVYDPDWTNPTAPTSDGILYCGYFFDAETANYHVRHRMYNTSLATWLSRDPIGYSAGDMNLYRYVGNNPIIYIDPTGLTKGGQQRIDVTGVPANATAEELKAIIAAAKARGANSKHIKALEGLLKVTKRNTPFRGGKGGRGCGGPIGIIIFIVTIATADDTEGALVDTLHPVSIVCGGCSVIGDAEIPPDSVCQHAYRINPVTGEEEAFDFDTKTWKPLSEMALQPRMDPLREAGIRM